MKMLVIDGNSILNRAFYGIRPLTTKDGQHTNAIFGFLTTYSIQKELVRFSNEPLSLRPLHISGTVSIPHSKT